MDFGDRPSLAAKDYSVASRIKDFSPPSKETLPVRNSFVKEVSNATRAVKSDSNTLGPLNYYFIFNAALGLFLMVGYFAGDCDATLAILGYNLLGEKLPHPDCGTAAVLFLRFFEASWLAIIFLFLLLGIAPKIGVGAVSKHLLMLIYLAVTIPMLGGIIVAFMITEIEPGLKYPYTINVVYIVVLTIVLFICYRMHEDARPGFMVLA